MQESKRLIKNTGLIAFGNLSTKLISFFLLPLYTSILSTGQYGNVDYIISIATFCVPFVSILMDESMFRFLIDCTNDSERKKVISLSMVIILVGSGAFLLIGIPVLYIIHMRYGMYLVLFILTSVISMMISALLRGVGRTDRYAVFNFLTGILTVILNVVFLAVMKLGVEGMLSAYIISQAGVSLLFIIVLQLWRYIDFSQIDMSTAKSMVVYSIPLIPNKISWSIINLSDRMVIMNYIGSSANGLYAMAYKFPTLMDTVYGFFFQAWKESSARVLGDKAQESFYESVYKYLKRFMFSIVLCMIAFMPLVFRILVDRSYYRAVYYVPILLFATYFSNISGFYGGVFTAQKDTKILGTTTIGAAVINLALNLLFIVRWGIYAAAGATLIATFLIYYYRKIKVRKYVFLPENLREQLGAIVTSAVVLICFYSQRRLLLVIGALAAMAYALIFNWSLIVTFILKITQRMKGRTGGGKR